MELIIQPQSLTWVPVETAINHAPGSDKRVKGDAGAVQRHVDTDGEVLPYEAHFAHVKVYLHREVGDMILMISPTLCRYRPCSIHMAFLPS